MIFFSKNIRFLRIARKLSQEGMAHALELNRGNIASYENGTAEPNLRNLIRIARFFNTDVFGLVETDLEKSLEVIAVLNDRSAFGNNLNPDSNIEGQLQKKLTINKNEIEHFRRRSDEMMKILIGFRQFHKFKMEKSGELSEDVKKMAMDYERLLDVLNEVLKSNENLIDLIESQ